MSTQHRYNILSHSVESIIVVPFTYVVHQLVHVEFRLLLQLYLAWLIHDHPVSVAYNVIVVFAFLHVVDEFVAETVGVLLSNFTTTVQIVLDNPSLFQV